MHAVIVVDPPSLGGLGETGFRPAEARVGGLTVLQRMLRSLQRAGVGSVTILADDFAALQAVTATDPELALELHWRPRLRVPLTDRLVELKDHLASGFWLMTADRMVSPRLFVRLEGEPNSVIALTDRGQPIGIDWVPLEALPNVATMTSWEDYAAGLAQAGRLVTFTPVRPLWHPVQTRADVEAASRVLLRSLRKPLGRNADGVTAYFINRPISLRISQRIVDTPLTPNQVTTLALVIGLLASILVARGSWSALVFGGLALQLSSILDGVDGELARMRLTTSTSGEWYDTICDDVTNLAMMTGLGVACYVRTGAPQYVWGTWVGVGIGCLVAALFYRELVRAKIASHNDLKWGFESDDTRGGPLRHIAVWFSYLAKRDTYTLVLGVLLAFNLPQVAFWLMVVGTLLIFVGYVAHKVAAAWFGAPDIA